jgi:hypothetical protein
MLLVGVLAGCGGDSSGEDLRDTWQDVVTDTAPDPAADPTLDTAVDTAADTAIDTAEDDPGDPGHDPVVAFPERFVRFTVDEDIIGPAYVSVADVTGDGQLDLVVSSFGGMTFPLPAGQVRLYTFTGDLDSWSHTHVASQEEGIKFPNATTVADVDGDGDLDVIVPSGFLACTMGGLGADCGGLAWFEQTDAGWTRHDVVENGSALFYHHALLHDFTGDGVRDMVTVGEEQGGIGSSDRAVTQMFAGTGDPVRFETTPREIGQGLGSIPQLHDVDGDDDLDIVSAEYFYQASFAWMEQLLPPSVEHPAGAWIRHVIADDVGPSIMLEMVPDLYGDGVTRAVGANHVNESKDGMESAVYVLDVPESPSLPWPKTKISTGIVSVPGSAMAPMAAPGIFGTGDVDGDGDIDVALSGDGDKRVFVLEQVAPGSFVTHVLGEDLGQAGGMKVTDLDDDGRREIVVTSYEANVIYVYEYIL